MPDQQTLCKQLSCMDLFVIGDCEITRASLATAKDFLSPVSAEAEGANLYFIVNHARSHIDGFEQL